MDVPRHHAEVAARPGGGGGGRRRQIRVVNDQTGPVLDPALFSRRLPEIEPRPLQAATATCSSQQTGSIGGGGFAVPRRIVQSQLLTISRLSVSLHQLNSQSTHFQEKIKHRLNNVGIYGNQFTKNRTCK